MIGEVTNTFVYPIKGMHGVEMVERGIRASTAVGVVGDRNFAIYRKPTEPPTAWAPKGRFWVCMNREGMATKIGETGLTEADLDDDYELDPEFVRGVLMGRDLPVDTNALVHTGGDWHIADTNKPCVSFLNLASVRDLEECAGVNIDPRRFRMNVWVEGLDPWVELDYITTFEEGCRFPMWIGDVQVHCDDLCERCKAITQSPETGLWDIELLEILEARLKERGYDGSPQRGKHAVMGWLAIPQNDGLIRKGQKLTFGTN
jgi:uncharacterized protein YcbX